MSFSKAKIQRFNEVHSCAPPPGAYNPTTAQEHPTGAVIPRSERFHTESPACSVHSGDTASIASGNGSIFRTPGMNRKKKTKVNSASKVSGTRLFSTNEASEALKEKIVECKNKDESIKELVMQIDELKDTISHLEVQQNQLNSENQQYENILQESKSKYEELLSQLKEKHELEIEGFNQNFQEELNKVKEESAQIKKELNEELLELSNNIKLFQDLQRELMDEHKKSLEAEQTKLAKQLEENNILEERYEGSLIALSELQRSHSEEIEKLKKTHLLEVQDIEYEMLKCMTEAQKSVELKSVELEKVKEEIFENEQIIKSLRQEIQNVKDDCVARLRQAEENSVEKIKLAEIQMEERCKDIEVDWRMKIEKQQTEAEEKSKEIEAHWSTKLKNQQIESETILSECQAIGEFNVIQCEMEKHEIKQELQEIMDRLQKFELEGISAVEDYEEVKFKLTEVSEELTHTKNELKLQLDSHEGILERSKNEKHAYQVSLNKALETVEALKNRLINSDLENEQLEEELANLKVTRLELEEKCNTLLDDLSNITEIKDELIAKVNSVEKSLLEKVDNDIQEITKKENDRLKNIIAEKEEQVKEAMSQLGEQQKFNLESQQLINTVKLELEQIECENTELKYVNSRLKSSVERLQQEIVETAEINRKYIEQSGKLDTLQHDFEEMKLKNKELEKTVELQNALIGPFREQLQGYEMERLTLLNEKSEALSEVREVSLRYAEMLGHQNSKQKIKHLVDLKQKNLDLTNANKEWEAKCKAQNKLVEKMKKELSERNGQKKSQKISNIVPNSDKENVSPLKLRNLH